MEPKYRHELKYEISYHEYINLKLRLEPIMKRDIHADGSGIYTIRSLYFDNFNDKALKEKLDGIKNRDKFRLRCYNNDFSFILLEKKSKRNSLCLKKSTNLTREQCEKILDGDIGFMADSENELFADFFAAMSGQLMRPKTVVVYKREPYIFEAGNVRITFDSDIRTGLYSTNFLDGDLPLIPVMGSEKMILEIKYDEFLPDVIRHAIQSGVPRVQAFSKYAAARQYE